MVLSIPYRNMVRRSIKTYVDDIIHQQVKQSSQALKKWKFSNSADFHYGHFVGMMEGICTSIFREFHGKKINDDEMAEVTDIIEELGKPFREYLKKNFD